MSEFLQLWSSFKSSARVFHALFEDYMNMTRRAGFEWLLYLRELTHGYSDHISVVINTLLLCACSHGRWPRDHGVGTQHYPESRLRQLWPTDGLDRSGRECQRLQNHSTEQQLHHQTVPSLILSEQAGLSWLVILISVCHFLIRGIMFRLIQFLPANNIS